MSQNVFFDPYVSIDPALVGAGNGTLTVDRLTHFTINQLYTVICTAIAPFTVFRVVGALDGPLGVAQVATPYHDKDLKVFFTINQGPTLFAIGDTFTFTVAQGTDLNHANIDTYDALPQKNFSAGTPSTDGDLAGDDNMRFSALALLAAISYQGLTLTSKLTEEDGNDISIEYLNGTVLAAASLVLQDLTFTADTQGAAGNGISVEYEDYDPAVKATATIQGLLYEAITAGIAGNSITIEYTTGAPTSTPVITVLGNAITVQIQSGITTHAQIKTEINADVFSSALVAAVNNILGTATAPDGPDSLTGGLDAVGDAGNEVVTVSTLAIKVKLQSGVSTATQVKAAVDAFGAAAALVNTTISGVGGNTQTAPVAPTNLAGGADDLGDPGNEVVTVVGRAITITFQNGVNTATDLKNAIEGFPAADALVTVTINTGQAAVAQVAAFGQEYLGGGASADIYSLNSNELSAPDDFYEGNANLLLKNLFVQGRFYVRGASEFRGVVRLDDINATANGSGSAIPNAQKALNDIITRENQDRNIKLVRGDNWTWTLATTTLAWATDAYVQVPGLPEARNRIPTGSVSMPTDGLVATVNLNRTAGAPATLAVTVTAIASVVLTDDIYIIARRIGNKIVRGGGDGAGIEVLKDSVSVDAAVEHLNFKGSGLIVTQTAPGSVDVEASLVNEDGNADIMLRPPIKTFILQSPDLTKWQVNVSNAGVLSQTSGATGPVSNFKVTKPDLSEASFDITDAGEIQVVSPPAGGETLDDKYYIASPDGTAWKIQVTDDDEIQVDNDPTAVNYARWTNDQGQVLAQIQECNGKALFYLSVYTTLPSPPPTIAGLLPMAFYDDGLVKRLAYWDGATWQVI